MDTDSKESKGFGFLPRTTASELRNRQSVRATFKLTPHAIETITIASVHLGIQQKSLFDHLIEDSQSLNMIAREIESFDTRPENRIQKTYVISRKTLYSLDKMSKEFDAPRDALVELSIQRLLPVIAREKERHKRRREIFAELSEHLEKGRKIFKKSETLLGRDDPVYDKLEKSMMVLEHTYHAIETYIEKCKIIEKF